MPEEKVKSIFDPAETNIDEYKIVNLIYKLIYIISGKIYIKLFTSVTCKNVYKWKYALLILKYEFLMKN